MPINPILKFVRKKDHKIPVHFLDDIKHPYLKQLKNQFAQTRKYLKAIDPLFFEPNIKQDEIKRITNIQQFIINVIQEYLNGHPSRAFEMFADNLRLYDLENQLSALQQICIPRDSVFFRIQKNNKKINVSKKGKEGLMNFLKPKEMFHPPFEYRRSVPTNRFSISGFPCLYLSHSLHTSYSECFPTKDSFGAFNANGYKNVRPMYLIDLSDEGFRHTIHFPGIRASKVSRSKADVSSTLDYIAMYQLILASHTKINYAPRYANENYYFKAEYIIPQLLLQWLKLKGVAIDGIQYKSCTSAKRFPKKRNHFNYIIPVKNNLVKGLCPSLVSLFKSTNVYSYLKDNKPSKLETQISTIENQIKTLAFSPIV